MTSDPIPFIPMIRFLKYLLAILLPVAAWTAFSLSREMIHAAIVMWMLLIGTISCGIAVIVGGNKYLMVTFLPSVAWVLWLVISISLLPWTGMNIILVALVVFILPTSGLLALLLRWFDKRRGWG